MQGNADYAEWFRGRPKRFEVNLNMPNMSKVLTRTLAPVGCETPRIHYDKYNGMVFFMAYI